MTWGELLTIITDMRREGTQDFVSNDEIMRYANLIVAEISSYYNWSFGENANYTIPLLPGVSAYALPDGFKSVLSVNGNLAGSTGAIPFEFQYLRPADFLATEKTAGYFYTIIGDEIHLSLPSADNIGNQVILNYYSSYLVVDNDTPPPFLKMRISSLNDTFKIPDRFQEAIIQGTLKFIFQKEGKPNDVTYAETRYNEILRQMIVTEPNKVDRPLRQFRHYMSGF
jgi:hypothetical protein